MQTRNENVFGDFDRDGYFAILFNRLSRLLAQRQAHSSLLEQGSNRYGKHGFDVNPGALIVTVVVEKRASHEIPRWITLLLPAPLAMNISRIPPTRARSPF